MKSVVRLIAIAVLSLSVVLSVGCNSPEDTATSTEAPAAKLSGSIIIDGSSTVYPITAAVAEEFNKVNKDVKIDVKFAGTGGGMKKFGEGTIQICDASRPIKQEEIDACKKNGVEYTELKVAFDGISVVVNKGNTWVKSLTKDQLKKMWDLGSTVKNWKDVDASWPDEAIKFYSPGTDSGTFDYFTEAINGKAKQMRKDITPSEDDNVLVTGVSSDKNAIGYFGFSYYEANAAKLNLIPIDDGTGKLISPTFQTIKDGTYKPLSRPLFLYVNNKAMKEAHVMEFLKYYLNEGKQLVKDVGYVQLEDAEYTTQLGKVK